MIGLFLLLSVSVCNLMANQSNSVEIFSISREFKRDLKEDRILEKTSVAIDAIMERTFIELSERGHKKEALEMRDEWLNQYQGFILNAGMYRDIGDHAGIAFLIRAHEKIENLLGGDLCRILRLHDLYTIAYTLPMVISCAGEYQSSINSLEYKKHFVPFCGVVSYWSTVGVCIVATGPGAFYCGFIGMGVEQIVIRFIAPKLHLSFYNLSCKE